MRPGLGYQGRMWLLASLAWAGSPTAVLRPDKSVMGTVSLAIAPSELRSRLADPRWVASVSGGGTTVAVRGRQGDCLVSDYTSPSAVMTVAYTVRQCATATGYRSTLVSSSDFDAYETEWSVTPEGEGSLLTYTIHLEPSLPFPTSMVTGTLRKEVEEMMQAFYLNFGTAK